MAFSTHKSLLDLIKAGNEDAWRVFYENYYHLIFSVGRHYNLDEDSCQDLVQQVMITFFEKKDSFCYNSELGKFRSYLWGMTRNIIAKMRKNLGSKYTSDETIDFDAVPSPQENVIYEEEWRKFLLQEAMKQLQQKVGELTFDAFQMYVFQGSSPNDVAKALSISVSTVYVHKNRCMYHLRQIIKELQDSDPDFNFYKR